MLLLAAAVFGLPSEPPGPNVTLLTGAQMPLVGFGCAGRLGAPTLREAANAGYRLFDTAQAPEWYDERALGEALAGGPRAFLTTKVHPRDFGPSSTAAAVERSLRNLRVDTLDLVMLHYPACWGQLCAGAPPPEGDWRSAWRALEAAQAAGKVRALGVSNFGLSELDELWAFAAGGAARPSVVQSMMDPFRQNTRVRQWCTARGVVFQAYSTLGTQHALGAGRAGQSNPVLGSALLQRIGHVHGRSVAQVALRWAIQSGAGVLPRSADGVRMRSNLRLFDFELTAAELAAIATLDGTDPHTAERAPRPADAPLQLRFVNSLDQRLVLRWGDASEPTWTLEPRAVLQLQSYAGHTFSAAAAEEPAKPLWRWTVPTPDDAAVGGAHSRIGEELLTAVIAPMGKTEL